MHNVILEGTNLSYSLGDVRAQHGDIGVQSLGKDSQLYVQFYDKMKQELVDGKLEWVKKEYIIMQKPNAKSWYDGPAKQAHKIRFSALYERYKRGNTQQVGTPLSMLSQQGLLQPSQVEMLRTAKIFTAEQLKSASSIVVNSFGPEGFKMQQIASGFLQYHEEVRLKAEKIAIDQRLAQLEAKEEEKPKKKGKNKSVTEPTEAAESEDLAA